MKNFTTVNKKIATAPFPTNQIKSTIKAGVALIEQSNMLTPLKVLYPSNEGIPAGVTVYVPGECMKHKWANEVYTTEDGTKFILVPMDMAVGFTPPDMPEPDDMGVDEIS